MDLKKSASKFQSTLPRGERPDIFGVDNIPEKISIHAPARGATHFCEGYLSISIHFNPRSREGSDEGRKSSGTGNRNFNPRSREGSDEFDDIGNPAGKWISIHAPARGATLCLGHSIFLAQNFNPRSREGSDSKRAYIPRQRQEFQSTLPRGERPIGYQYVII